MKERLDKILVEKGYVRSRERARAVILKGDVIVNNNRIDKPGIKIDINSNIRIKGNDIPYVSRGGIKLEGALDDFEIDVDSKIAMDIGASTGGFTHCLLKRGVKKVYAIDVGYGQLAWELRIDPRVVILERRNIRYLNKREIDDDIELAVIDLSFISLRKVLSKVVELIKEGGDIVALIKPQFELEKGEVGKGGIVRDREKHELAVMRIVDYAKELALVIKSIKKSRIDGIKGNKEFFIYLRKPC
jgi:23S rRNA (cytidine1920-2'-O)/16S rRNA (cytidine1409-2'-O)-methyltransferase